MIGEGLNFTGLLYRPIFDRLARTAKLTLVDGRIFNTMPNGQPLVALDKTVGVALPQANAVVLETLTPMAEFMMADLLALGLAADDLDKGVLELNSKTWDIISHRMNPSNSGEADGTVYVQLEGASG
jgi:hypothetical protein